MMLPWPWFRGRVVVGGDAAHTFPPHLTQGAAMAAEDAYVLANEVLSGDAPVKARLTKYSIERYARCAFVYSFARQWMEDEQSVRTAQDLVVARSELALNASVRIGASDRILNSRIF
jgi:2-polyprenyl-6-methoxyphenol hydroxylase-like FAD-dependent oxidoreductase